MGTLLESASPAEVTLSERTLARVSAPRWGRGRPRQKPDRLIDDKAAAADALRKRLRARGIDVVGVDNLFAFEVQCRHDASFQVGCN